MPKDFSVLACLAVVLCLDVAAGYNPSRPGVGSIRKAALGVHRACRSSSQAVASLSIEAFTLESICRDGAQGEVARAFRRALKRDSVAIVEPGAKGKAAIAALAKFAESFFALDHAVQDSFGPLHEPDHSDAHCGQRLPTGVWLDTRRPVVNRFIDTRLRRARHSSPTDCGLEVLPRSAEDGSLQDVCPGCHEVLVEGQLALYELGSSLLRTALTFKEGCVPNLTSLVDNPSELAFGVSGSTVHRFGWYPSNSSQSPEGNSSQSSMGDTNDTPEVCFDAHTDSTWFTLIPCSSVPGLEVNTSTGWTCPEEESSLGSVAVMVGEGLQYMTDCQYYAAPHRVMRPSPGSSPRISAVFLMRPSPRFVSKLQSWQAARLEVLGYKRPELVL